VTATARVAIASHCMSKGRSECNDSSYPQLKLLHIIY